VNSKYIFKTTLTPKQAQKEMEEHKSAVGRTTSSPPHYVSARNRLPLPFTAQVRVSYFINLFMCPQPASTNVYGS
jgi:hypothetical protein